MNFVHFTFCTWIGAPSEPSRVHFLVKDTMKPTRGAFNHAPVDYFGQWPWLIGLKMASIFRNTPLLALASWKLLSNDTESQGQLFRIKMRQHADPWRCIMVHFYFFKNEIFQRCHQQFSLFFLPIIKGEKYETEEMLFASLLQSVNSFRKQEDELQTEMLPTCCRIMTPLTEKKKSQRRRRRLGGVADVDCRNLTAPLSDATLNVFFFAVRVASSHGEPSPVQFYK